MWELISNNDQSVSVYAIDNTYLESFSKEQFEEFITVLIGKKKQQIAEQYNSFPATFYMWFDEMAAQLRFNIISGHAIQLPFECSLEIVNSVEPIWQEFKQSPYHEGISWSELEFFEDDEDDIEENEEEYTLKVYVQKI